MIPYSSVIVSGSVAYDEIMDFPGQFVDHFHPEKLHQINISFVVDKLKKQLGGIATNIAYNLRLVTKKDIFLLSAVGRDGESFMKFFKENNIQASGIVNDKILYTATGKVITDKKDNQIWGYYYGALASAKGGEKQLFEKIIAKDSLVIISATHELPFLSIQNYSIAKKIDYAYDPGMALTWISDANLEKGVLNCRYLIGNDYEIAQLERRLKLSVKKLIQRGISVITTLGEHGVRYQDNKTDISVKAFKVKKIIDPTGAGDAFRGGFFGALVDGKSIQESLKQGNALASFAIEKYGTINHKPAKKEIHVRIQKVN